MLINYACEANCKHLKAKMTITVSLTLDACISIIPTHIVTKYVPQNTSDSLQGAGLGGLHSIQTKYMCSLYVSVVRVRVGGSGGKPSVS